MAPEFKIFHGVGAVVKEVINDTKLLVLAVVDGEDIKFSNPTRKFEVDLEATPCTAGTSAWSAIKFDDRGVDEDNDELPLEQNVVAFRRGRGPRSGPVRWKTC